MSSEFEQLRDLILQTRDELLSAIESSTVKEADKEAIQFAKRYIEKHGFICWSKAREEPDFLAHFRHNTRFHRLMTRHQDVFGWKRLDCEKKTYFYREGFDVAAIAEHLDWQNHKPSDGEFLDWIIKSIVAKESGKKVNVFARLETEYPEKGTKWRNQVVIALGERVDRYWKGTVGRDGGLFWIVT